jgi:hypothetical protein
MPSNAEVGNLPIATPPPTPHPTNRHHHFITNFVKFCNVCLITFSQFGKLVKINNQLIEEINVVIQNIL